MRSKSWEIRLTIFSMCLCFLGGWVFTGSSDAIRHQNRQETQLQNISSLSSIPEILNNSKIISYDLKKHLEHLKDDEFIRILITMRGQADLRGVRGEYNEVRRRLQAVADERESRQDSNSIRMVVENLNRERLVKDIQKYWLVNAYSFLAKKAALEILTECPDIQRIEKFPEVELDAVEVNEPTECSYYGPAYVKAPEAWAMGYEGEGVLVGIIDDGVWTDHPALQGKIQTLQSGDAAGKPAFFNGTSVSNAMASTSNSHGTHVTGIVLGGKAVGGSESIDPEKTIGVAPKAKFLFGLSGNPVNSMQWIADPDQNPETQDYPMMINNSWIKSSNADLQDWIDNLEALGITIVFSAGNSGKSGPKSIKNIHTYPTPLLVANTMENNKVNPGSSQGPAVYLLEEFTKPDVAAPGTNILSSVYPGAYPYDNPDLVVINAIYKMISGTSMSAPMVTGVITLVQEAYFKTYGEYLSPAKVKCILQLTAINLGNDDGKDMKTGSGLVNAIKAIELALNHVPISGKVINSLGNPVPFVKIKFIHDNLKYEMYTNVDGEFELALHEGSFEFLFEKLGHEAASYTANTASTQSVANVEITLQDAPAYLVIGQTEMEILAGMNGSTTEILTLANFGSQDLVIDEIIHPNSHISFDNTFPIVIPPFESMELSVIYSPTKQGEEEDLLNFKSNSATNPSVLIKCVAHNNLFTDFATQAGLDKHPFNGSYTTSDSMSSSLWADIDKNNFPDIFLTDHNNPKNQFLSTNQGNGSFTTIETMNGLAEFISAYHGENKVFVDLDNDGDQDFISEYIKGSTKTKFFLNDGKGIFNQEITGPSAVSNSTNILEHLIFKSISDIDKDGRLDFVISDSLILIIWKQINMLEFAFEEKVLLSQPADVVLAIDFDNDGKEELLCLSQHSIWKQGFPTSKLYFIHNLDTEPEIIDLEMENVERGSLAVSDYDNDGDMDIYVQIAETIDGSIAQDVILRNEGGLSFTPIPSPYVPTSETHVYAGAPVWVDYDNDGLKDLFFAYGKKGYNRLFKNLGNGQFEEVAKLVGIHGLADQSSEDSFENTVCVDYDQDGDMDFFVGKWAWFDVLYKNNYYEHGNTHHWLDIHLIGIQSNRDAIGARAVLHFKDGTLQSDQVLYSHQSYGHGFRQIHFGLGQKTAEDIDKLVIYWPSGMVQERKINHVDKVLTVSEIQGDLNYDSQVDTSDVSLAIKELLDYLTGISNYSDELDMNCDDSFSIVDVHILIQNILYKLTGSSAFSEVVDEDQDGILDSCEAT